MARGRWGGNNNPVGKNQYGPPWKSKKLKSGTTVGRAKGSKTTFTKPKLKGAAPKKAEPGSVLKAAQQTAGKIYQAKNPESQQSSKPSAKQPSAGVKAVAKGLAAKKQTGQKKVAAPEPKSEPKATPISQGVINGGELAGRGDIVSTTMGKNVKVESVTLSPEGAFQFHVVSADGTKQQLGSFSITGVVAKQGEYELVPPTPEVAPKVKLPAGVKKDRGKNLVTGEPKTKVSLDGKAQGNVYKEDKGYTWTSLLSPGDGGGPFSTEDEAIADMLANHALLGEIRDTPRAQQGTETLSTPAVPAAPDPFKPVGKLKKTGKKVGSHGSEILVDEDGQQWLHKKDEFSRSLDPAVAALHRLMGLETPIFQQTGDGHIQKLVPNSSAAFGYPNGFKPEALSAKDLDTILTYQILDYVTGNYDAHAGQWLKTPKGLMQIDQGQAFKFGVGKPMTYSPPGNVGVPVYKTLWDAFYAGKIDIEDPSDPNSTLGKALDKLASIDNLEFRNLFQPYAEQRWPNNKAKQNEFLDLIVANKQNAKTSLADLYDAFKPESNDNDPLAAFPALAPLGSAPAKKVAAKKVAAKKAAPAAPASNLPPVGSKVQYAELMWTVLGHNENQLELDPPALKKAQGWAPVSVPASSVKPLGTGSGTAPAKKTAAPPAKKAAAPAVPAAKKTTVGSTVQAKSGVTGKVVSTKRAANETMYITVETPEGKKVTYPSYSVQSIGGAAAPAPAKPSSTPSSTGAVTPDTPLKSKVELPGGNVGKLMMHGAGLSKNKSLVQYVDEITDDTVEDWFHNSKLSYVGPPVAVKKAASAPKPGGFTPPTSSQGGSSSSPLPSPGATPTAAPASLSAAQDQLKPVQDKHWPGSYEEGYRMAPRDMSLNGDWQPNKTQASAMKYYTTSLGCSNINSQLRHGVNKGMTERIKAIDRAFEQAPPLESDLVLSRKMSGNGPFPDYPPPMTPGARFRDKAYVSTSKDPNAFGGSVKMQVRVGKGKKVLDMNHTSGSAFPHEYEMLLPRGTEFKIVSDTKVGGERKIIVEVV